MSPEQLILNVDDHEPGRYALTRTLQREGFEVLEAGTGAECLRLAEERRPDLILLDVNLPDTNGMDVCRRLKKNSVTSAIPVIHISASSLAAEHLAAGLDSGADAYLTEPLEPTVLRATIRSVLRLHAAEQATQAAAAQWQATFDAIRDGLAVLDLEGRVQRLNHSLAQLLNRNSEELIGFPVQRLWDSLPDTCETPAFVRMLESRKREEMDVQYGERWFHVTSDPLLESSGRLGGAVYIVSDITERRRMESELRERQRMESVGTLAAGVAHDFNNLLTGILGNASVALEELPPSSPSAGRLEQLMRAGERAADLTRQLLAYAGKGRFVLRNINLSETLRGMQDLMRASIPRRITLVLELHEAPPEIEADPQQIQQVIMDLLTNAAEAIGEGDGTIWIRTAPENGGVLMEVRDTGQGIAPEHQPRIFDPFFSTKFAGRGLGLAAVSGIVRSHQGTVAVESQLGKGSSFRVWLPTGRQAKKRASSSHPDLRGSGTILVVDDEELIQHTANAALRYYGYDVLIAGDGRQGIELLRQNADRITAVLLDLTMPVMDGDEALDRMLTIRPDIPVIVTSGREADETLRHLQGKKVAGVLQKPFTVKQLVEIMKRAR